MIESRKCISSITDMCSHQYQRSGSSLASALYPVSAAILAMRVLMQFSVLGVVTFTACCKDGSMESFLEYYITHGNSHHIWAFARATRELKLQSTGESMEHPCRENRWFENINYRSKVIEPPSVSNSSSNHHRVSSFIRTRKIIKHHNAYQAVSSIITQFEKFKSSYL